MVCYGPSKGCKRCRQRKIKCDERRPFCRNCEKSKRECPGYDRGNGTIAFRDETTTVVQQSQSSPESKGRNSPASSTYGSSSSSIFEEGFQKANTKPKSARKQTNSSTTDQFSIPPSHDHTFDMMATKPDTSPLVIANDFIPLGLPQDPEQQSVAFFMSNFALKAEQSEEIWGGCLQALPAFLEKASPKSPLAAAATTTSMAAIAWSPGCSDYRRESLSRYVTSLKRINEALKDPKQAKSDNLLMAVLMLGFYENIKTLTMQKSDKESHTRGAIALIKARKPGSFRNRASLRLFLAVKAQLLSQCIEKCDPAPYEDFMTATEGTVPDDFVPSCADRLVMLSKDIPHLRQREKQLIEETDIIAKRTQAEGLLADAQDTDALLDLWASIIPREYQFTSFKLPTLPGPQSADLYPSSMDIYYDHTMASTWNTWRTTRIRVLQIIISCANIINPPISDLAPAYESKNAIAAIQGLANDICASVPFHLGHHEPKVSNNENIFTKYPHPPGQARWPENFAASGAVGGWLMMQPLAFVSRPECIPQSQREWVKEYLTTFMRDSRDMRRITPPPTSPHSPVTPFPGTRQTI